MSTAMDPVGRKLLPLMPSPIPPSNRSTSLTSESLYKHTQPPDRNHEQLSSQQRQPLKQDEAGQKRNRQPADELQLRQQKAHRRSPSQNIQTLPSVRHLLPPGLSHPPNEAEKNSQPRLVRLGHDTYIHEGLYQFRAPPPPPPPPSSSPPPHHDFPSTITSDTRPLSFAVLEPELTDIFRHAWFLRQYIRLKRSHGETWLDHIFFHDGFGIETALHTWTSRYDPGTREYPVSMLYKNCLWLFFNRSVQASQASSAFAQVVDDGLHFLRGAESSLGPSGDRSILLIPLFMLGVSAFHPEQRQSAWEALGRVDASSGRASVEYAGRTLERIWSMMDEGTVAETWDWEKYSQPWPAGVAGDCALVDLLHDPLAMAQVVRQPTHNLPSPTNHKFEYSQSRETQLPLPSTTVRLPHQPLRSTYSSSESGIFTPPRTISPPVKRSLAPLPLEQSNDRTARSEGSREGAQIARAPLTPGPRPYLAVPPGRNAPPPLATPLSNSQPNAPPVTQSILQSKPLTTRTKTAIPPCPVCGKELKNPSDAQKHQLQHSKPFRCHEPHCTRIQGFATENDLQRHRKSVHGAAPRIGNKLGYVCAACVANDGHVSGGGSGSGGTRAEKWWPRLDNFKAHIRRKHPGRDEEEVIALSVSASRPGDETSTSQGNLNRRVDVDIEHDAARSGSGSGSAGSHQTSESISSTASLRWTDEQHHHHDQRKDAHERNDDDEDVQHHRPDHDTKPISQRLSYSDEEDSGLPRHDSHNDNGTKRDLRPSRYEDVAENIPDQKHHAEMDEKSEDDDEDDDED